MSETATGSGFVSSPRPWAPGVIAMVAWTTVLVFALSLGSVIFAVTNENSHFLIGATLVVAILASGLMSHLTYKQAERALAADPNLRGDDLVENLWWVAALVLFGAPMAFLPVLAFF